jgi:hypothetical protein
MRMALWMRTARDSPAVGAARARVAVPRQLLRGQHAEPPVPRVQPLGALCQRAGEQRTGCDSLARAQLERDSLPLRGSRLRHRRGYWSEFVERHREKGARAREGGV